MMASKRWLYASPLAMNPCGATLYLYLPHGVMNVVMCRSSMQIGTEWYPFHASVTDFFVP
ncbi:hypothetical protein DPMN_006265 [Dreissena polymorpha]|uniref:Uncharacterized protein n=1 Tax=Dreissena polymorpha TaxID=45954 RepID=A0A9D4RX88_DREPO|nr:hypothetical protein DPMN_006265 [Dreissena polymorpha]